jgi:hypothetical protein
MRIRVAIATALVLVGLTTGCASTAARTYSLCDEMGLTPAIVYVGTHLDRATPLARQRGEVLRVVQQDGVQETYVADRVPNRVDLAVRGQTVLQACHE